MEFKKGLPPHSCVKITFSNCLFPITARLMMPNAQKF